MSTLDYLPWRRPAGFDALRRVRDDTNDLTCAELSAWVDAAAEQLAEHGVARGSMVAIMLANRVERLMAMVAAWRLGAVARCRRFDLDRRPAAVRAPPAVVPRCVSPTPVGTPPAWG